jgi:SGNH domain (fused to AT3 domains)
VGTAMSTIAMVWWFDPGDPSRAYYGTDTRIHQPLIGALLALLFPPRRSRADDARSRIAALGGAAILLSAFCLLSDKNPAYYRGLSVAIPLAAAAFIWGVEASPSAWLARVLSWEPVRWIGQISYGLYLWHWPVIIAIVSVPRPLRMLPGSLGMNLTRVLVTFAIATASFYLVEQPIRHGRARFVRLTPRFATLAVVSLVLATGTVLWTTTTAGVPAAELEIPLENSGCPPVSDVPCLRSEGSRRAPVIALVGDSIARSLDPAFMTLARDHNWTYVLAAANGCRLSHLMTSYEGQVRPADRNCYDVVPRLLDRLITEWNPAAVVALDRWEIIDVIGPDGDVVESATPRHIALTEQALSDTARTITSRGAQLIFIELPPPTRADCANAARRLSADCRVPVANDRQQPPYNAMLERIATQVPRVSTISITDAVCPQEICLPEVDGMLLRYDGLHFTTAASRWLAPVLYRRLIGRGVIPRDGRR